MCLRNRVDLLPFAPSKDIMHTTSLSALGAGFRHHASVRPDHIALTIGDRRLTYGQADATARRWQRAYWRAVPTAIVQDV